jgi:hypothetical protein
MKRFFLHILIGKQFRGISDCNCHYSSSWDPLRLQGEYLRFVDDPLRLRLNLYDLLRDPLRFLSDPQRPQNDSLQLVHKAILYDYMVIL